MVLKGSSLARVRTIQQSEPFAVTVNQEVIYIGWFWPSFLSSSCACIVVEPLWRDTENTIRFRLGYATASDLSSIDRRNAAIILSTFERDGKLK